jgi:hypothetical protein
MNQEQAEKEAIFIVSLVQGTMSLEGQGLPKAVLEKMVQQTIEELMNAPVCKNCGAAMLYTDPLNQCNSCDYMN